MFLIISAFVPTTKKKYRFFALFIYPITFKSYINFKIFSDTRPVLFISNAPEKAKTIEIPKAAKKI